MTKRLEEVLNLPESKKIMKTEYVTHHKKQQEDEKNPKPMFRDIAELDKISSALPKVKGLGDISYKELDALAQRATDAFDDLMDLGMNVEARYSSRVFEVASSMLKNAIDAKSSKIDKKLKMIELQIKKQTADQKAGNSDVEALQGEGVIITDRNSLLEKLKNMDK